jgi:phosphoribosylaminoimidazole (AIR) synthetase
MYNTFNMGMVFCWRSRRGGRADDELLAALGERPFEAGRMIAGDEGVRLC